MAANCAAREFAARPVGGTQYSGNAQGADHERTASRYGTRYHRPRHTQSGQSPRTGRSRWRAFGLRVVGLDAFPDLPEVEETGTTFEENALLKAREVSKRTGLVAIADDSGLEVDALNGAPGVYSARYSEDMPDLPGATKDERNTMKLLAALSSVRLWNRSARFRTVVAVCTPEGETLVAPGTWEGSVACSPRGKNGFGYDPVFLDPELGLTAAEMSPEEKMSRSHRAKALRELLRLWPSFWEGYLRKRA